MRNYRGRRATRLAAGATLLAAVALWDAPPPAHAARAVQVVAGDRHTCALTVTGGVKCWGDNNLGQLGDGTLRFRQAPVDVIGLTNGVAQIAAGGGHTCALTTGGSVKCWGADWDGQVGVGSPRRHRGRPHQVVGLDNGVTAISGGHWHSCAVADGGATCWGYNAYGQLGDGSETSASVPVPVAGLGEGISTVAGGGLHTCAATGAGAAKCWGHNGDGGPLGNGTLVSSTVPVDVLGLDSGVAALTAGGSFSCALMAAGTVKCWGWNQTGQIGDGTTENRPAPTDVPGISGATDIDAGNEHACALMLGGKVRCWGSNSSGELGVGNLEWILGPVSTIGLPAAVQDVSAGGAHTCAVLTDGRIVCWGSSSYGQLGNNSSVPRRTRPGLVARFGGVRTAISLRVRAGWKNGRRALQLTARVYPRTATGRVMFHTYRRWPGLLPIEGCLRRVVQSGRANCTYFPPTVGTYAFRAGYLGTTRLNGSKSAKVIVDVP